MSSGGEENHEQKSFFVTHSSQCKLSFRSFLSEKIANISLEEGDIPVASPYG
jgi:hypothetical protein